MLESIPGAAGPVSSIRDTGLDTGTDRLIGGCQAIQGEGDLGAGDPGAGDPGARKPDGRGSIRGSMGGRGSMGQGIRGAGDQRD